MIIDHHYNAMVQPLMPWPSLKYHGWYWPCHGLACDGVMVSWNDRIALL